MASFAGSSRLNRLTPPEGVPRTDPKNFRQELAARQLEWRRRQGPEVNQEPLVYTVRDRNRSLELAFPRDHWKDNLWPGVRTEVERQLRRDIKAHKWKNHLLSSWAACSNLYLPFSTDVDGRALLTGFLRSEVTPGLARILRVELEYAVEESDDLHPSKLLGESGGGRGSGQTSPDLAFLGELESGGPAILLVESKLTEHSFYPCSHLKARNPNPEPQRCHRMGEVVRSPETMCHQNQSAPRGMGRRYWTVLQKAANVALLEGLPHCPALHAGYQLLRQHALAEGYAASGRFDLVISAVAYDERNDELISSLEGSGIPDFRSDWGGLFRGRSNFRSWTHQAWVRWVREHCDRDRWSEWLKYVAERYGYGRAPQ